MVEIDLKAFFGRYRKYVPKRALQNFHDDIVLCLENQAHASPIRVKVSSTEFFDIPTEELMIAWIPIPGQEVYFFQDVVDYTESGACGMALLVLETYSGYEYQSQTKRGTGASKHTDYWLFPKGKKPPRDNPLKEARRLVEVSGILHANEDNSLSKRLKKKEERLMEFWDGPRPKSGMAPTYIVVTDFGEPHTAIQFYDSSIKTP